ncbi:retropepsin-like domain-containing protein [Microbulbifer sp. OS29]|uniref:Retropepsin-like domain-containing protein n=1 Tax=Microbulbifer okhotskensis TaxID=2926617 RepID=A0A9X2J756_9GAMM|nr:retropepsin-like aspartic protease [Microbulbifer okhotskensis]MCO1335430.1 retropepsin-like domain-containing protein [Microbulbifer okhotskensis]
MKQIIASLVAMALLGGCTTAQELLQKRFTHLPMRMTAAGHVYVYGSIEPIQDYPLIIDTAANSGVLPIALLEKLHLSASNIVKEEIQGATGKMEMLTGTVSHISLGDQTISDITFIFFDKSNSALTNGLIPGIVGHNYLKNYCIEFDFNNDQFNLAENGCPKHITANLKKVPFVIDDEFIKTRATFDGVEVDVILDSGAPRSFINNALLSLLENVEIGEQTSTYGLTAHQQQRTEIHQVGYQLGKHAILEPNMYVADLSIFDDLGYQKEPFLLLGLDYFRDGRLVIDYQNGAIYF